MADEDSSRDEGWPDDIGSVEKDDALFVNLVLIFQGAAMQQMGKVLSPLSGKIERNLEQARFSIDTLAMLREKTRGNLSGDLERLVDSALVNLRMNFVEEAAKPEPERTAASGDRTGETGEMVGAGGIGGAQETARAEEAGGPKAAGDPTAASDARPGAGAGEPAAEPDAGRKSAPKGENRPKGGSKRGKS
jgi:hypothetical protein